MTCCYWGKEYVYLGGADGLEVLEVPEFDLAAQVPEARQAEVLREGVEDDCVAVVLAEDELRLAVLTE